jgi:pimeloyl-ACP methyl ester carboxylesterase
MLLNTREWGSGDRIALLVHGIMSDARTWRRVGPALAERGYHAVAVNLRGHGASGRTEHYPTEAYAAIEVETFAVWDRQTALDLSKNAVAVLEAGTAGDGTGLPQLPAVPSLVILADSGSVVGPQDAETLRERGFTLRTEPGAGHTVHRDDFEGFMTALDGWI